MHSLKDELKYFFSGQGMPYGKVSLMIALIVSILFTVVYSNNYIKDAKIAVIDLDNSKFSHEFIAELNASPYMKVQTVLNVPAEPAKLFYQNQHIAVVYLPVGFEKKVNDGTPNSIGVFYDNINEAESSNIKGALNTIIAIQNQKIGQPQIQAMGVNSEQAEAIMSNISLQERLLFNPTSTHSSSMTLGFLIFFASMFFVFASIGMIARLRLEHKWEEELTRSPFDLLSRLVPYCVCLTVSIMFGLAVLKFFSDLSFAGNVFTFLLSVIIHSVSLGCICMLFGWSAPNPGIASSKMILFLPAGFIMGGATGPIGMLPIWVQYVTNVFPLVWEYRFTRDIILRGASFMDIAQEFGGFIIYMSILIMLVCFKFYRERNTLMAGEDTATLP